MMIVSRTSFCSSAVEPAEDDDDDDGVDVGATVLPRAPAEGLLVVRLRREVRANGS